MSRQPITVLLAEDEEPWMIILKEMLEDNGFVVTCVEDAAGVEARWKGVQVLVIDALLGEPLKDALGVVVIGRLLKEIPPPVPIVFVSILAHGDIEAKLREHDIPPDRYVWLQKNFEEEFFVQVILDELGKRTGLA